MQSLMRVNVSQMVVLFGLALTMLSLGGCTGEYKKTRAMERAEAHFKAGAYEKARLEYLNVLKREPQNAKAVGRVACIYFERGQVRSAYPFLAAARKLDPNNVDVAFQLGTTFLGAGEFKRAREQATFILEKQPSHEEAVLMLAESARQPEEVKQTAQRLDELQKSLGETPAIALARNSLYRKQNDTNAAEKAILHAYQLNSNSPPALIALATVRWTGGDLKAADRLFARAAELSPVRSTRWLRWVEFKIQTGALEEGKKILKDLNSKVTDHLPALAYEAKIAFAERKFEDCLAIGQKILAYDNSNYDALLLRARVRMTENKPAEALKDLERLKSVYTHVPEPRYYAAVAHLASEEVDKAIVNLTQASTLDPGYLPAILLLAELNLRQGDSASAVQLLSPLVKQQPKVVQPYLLLAAAYRAQDRLDDVNSVYRQMTVLFPKEADPYFLMGLTYRQQGRRADARKSFHKAHEMNPKHVQALNQLIDLDIVETNYDAAWKRVQSDISADPKSPDLQFLAAKLHVAQQEFGKAEEALAKVLDLDSAYQPAYAALAQLYVDSKKHDLALQQLQAGVAKNPKDFVSLMKMGMIYELLKDYTKAAETYEKLLSQTPKFAPALNNLAYLYTERMPHMEKAYQLAQKAREISPHDPFTADTLGWVLFKRGEYSWALKLIQECADRITDHPDVQYHLGMAYYMTGAEESARTALAKALASEKKFEGRVEAEARLAVLNTDLSKPAAELINELGAVLEKWPKDFIAWLRLGGVHERQGEFDKARHAYEKALHVNPKSVTAIMTLARLHAEQLRNQPKAMELAKEARSLAPDNPVIVEMLGPLAYQAHDYSWALTLLQKSNQDRPNRPTTLYYLGLCYFFNVGDIGKAEETLKKALEVSASFPEAEGARECLFFIDLCNRPEKAVQEEARIAEALKRDPNYGPALFAQAVMLEKKGQLAEAKQSYEKVLARNPDAILVAKRLGILCERLKEDRRAMELLSKVRETFTKDLEVARALGILAGRKGDFEWSAALLREVALGQSKPDAELLFNLGIAQYRLKQRAESKETLNKALAMNDQGGLAEEARRILTELNKKP